MYILNLHVTFCTRGRWQARLLQNTFVDKGSNNVGFGRKQSGLKNTLQLKRSNLGLESEISKLVSIDVWSSTQELQAILTNKPACVFCFA